MGRGGRARSGSGSRSGSSSRSCSGGSSSFKSTTAKTPRELVEMYLGAAAIIAGGGNSVAGGGSLARTNSSGDFEDQSLWCQELMNCYYDASRLCGDDHYMTRTAKVDRRLNTNPDGSQIQTISEFDFPLPFCESWVKDLYKHIDNYEKANFYLKILRNSCGIDVKLRKLRNELKEKGFVQLHEQKNDSSSLQS